MILEFENDYVKCRF